MKFGITFWYSACYMWAFSLKVFELFYSKWWFPIFHLSIGPFTPGWSIFNFIILGTGFSYSNIRKGSPLMIWILGFGLVLGDREVKNDN